MKHRVFIHPDAEADLDAIIAAIAAEYPLTARRVAERFADQIRTLASFPRLGALAREHGSYELELRQSNIYAYRVIYTIARRTVHVLRIIHASRQNLRPGDLPRLPDGP